MWRKARRERKKGQIKTDKGVGREKDSERRVGEKKGGEGRWRRKETNEQRKKKCEN